MEIKMTSFGFPSIKIIELGGDDVNEKLRVHMGIFAKMCNKIAPKYLLIISKKKM
jgi:hypothetical protein